LHERGSTPEPSPYLARGTRSYAAGSAGSRRATACGPFADPATYYEPQIRNTEGDHGIRHDLKGSSDDPEAIRDRLGVKPGDRIKFFVRPDGSVVLLPTVPVSEVRGFLKYDGPPVTLEDMDEAIAARAAERNR